MAATYVFEELDAATRDYLVDVRDRQGRGAPGVFVPVKNSMPLLGVILGPCVVILTLICTLVPSVGVILDDPVRAAMLQTAGVLLGGWMFVAALRVWAGKSSAKYAGHWVYVDPLYLYQAGGDRVKVTQIDDASGAEVTQHYNNNAYQHSAVRIRTGGKGGPTFNVAHERRAEQMVVYLNYLAWARGPDGGARATLPPARLGALAKYVAKNENEPTDGNGDVDFDLVKVNVEEVPEEPQRDGRAVPNFIPYVVMLVAGVVFCFVMVKVNTPIRDDAIYEVVTRSPVEPRFLRSYLIDPRNTAHRQQAYDRLAPFYDPAVTSVRGAAKDPALRDGFIQVLDSLRRADQPVVSIRVTETRSPPGDDGAAARTKALREGIADRTNEEFAKVAPAVQPPPDTVFTEQPPPVGHQLIAFAVMPDDAPAPHFDVSYAFAPDAKNPGTYTVAATVVVRVKVEDDPLVTKTFTLAGRYPPGQLDEAVTSLKEQVIRDMVGVGGVAAFPINPIPANPFPVPQGNW